MTNVLTELHDKINEGVTAVEGWVDEIKGHLPQVAAYAEKVQNSPIVQALEGVLLPPNVEAEIARLIQEAAAAFAEHGTATVTGTAGPAATEPTEATPAEATPATTDIPPAA